MKIYLPPILEVSNKYLHFKHIKTVQHSTAVPIWSLLQLSEGKELALTHLDQFTQSPSYAQEGWAGPEKNVCKAVWREKQTKKPLTATVCKSLNLEVLNSPQELLLWSIFVGPMQCDKNTEWSDGICSQELEVAQQPWHRPSRAEGSPGSISAAQGTLSVKPTGPRSVPAHPSCPSRARAAAGTAGREGSTCTQEALEFHWQSREGNGFCLLHERETPTNLKPEM